MTVPFTLPADMADCETRIDILDHDQMRIKADIATACIARNGGARVDEDWLRKARHARQGKLEELQFLRTWIRKARQQAGLNIQTEIVRICQERSTPSEWAAIVMLAEERVRSAFDFTERNGL